ncbi:MAG: hypothetical protein JXA62_04370 [Candidatus Aminicenantes bacterium]|nr:hypothetical protein [Candidatus Aminicenantes bacterium]
MNNVRRDNGDDGLKQLESMLERDLLRNKPAIKGCGVTRDQVSRAFVRLGISLLLLLLLFWLEVFENAATVLIGIVLVAAMEGVLLFIGRSVNESHSGGE